MPTVSPSLAGLDDRDKRLVRAYCAIYRLHVAQGNPGWTLNMLRECQQHMDGTTTLRAAQWEGAFWRMEVGDANL